MECNKEEAVRAMQKAEKKLHDSDYVGARRIAQTAQRLDPKLEHLNQLLAVAEVHCSSQTKLSGQVFDWYQILHLQPTADQETIRKQYKKLALLLHPDKNKFHGAEAAFKLVGEANELLTDPTKRSAYDENLRESRTSNGNETAQKEKEDFNSSQNDGSSKMSKEETQSFNDCANLLNDCLDLVHKYSHELRTRGRFQECMLILQRCYRMIEENNTSLLEKEFLLLVQKLLSKIQEVR